MATERAVAQIDIAYRLYTELSLSVTEVAAERFWRRLAASHELAS